MSSNNYVFVLPAESLIAKFTLILELSMLTTFRTNSDEFGMMILGQAASTSSVANMKVIAYPVLLSA